MTMATGLLVDYGGVLTTPVTHSFRAFCGRLGLDSELVTQAFVEAYSDEGDALGPVHRVETGALSGEQFARELAVLLSRRARVPLAAEGLLQALFAGVEPSEPMLAAVAAARAAGVRTGLLSNSWGADDDGVPIGYPHERLHELFDAVVISGQVGLRKPDPRIFALAASRLGKPAQACVFVDDLEANVRAAEAAGMAGIVHRHPDATIPVLAHRLGLDEARLRAS